MVNIKKSTTDALEAEVKQHPPDGQTAIELTALRAILKIGDTVSTPRGGGYKEKLYCHFRELL